MEGIGRVAMSFLGGDLLTWLSCAKRSMVYVEGECNMNKFTDKDGKPQSALNIIQREFVPALQSSVWNWYGRWLTALVVSPPLFERIGSIDILDKRSNDSGPTE